MTEDVNIAALRAGLGQVFDRALDQAIPPTPVDHSATLREYLSDLAATVQARTARPTEAIVPDAPDLSDQVPSVDPNNPFTGISDAGSYTERLPDGSVLTEKGAEAFLQRLGPVPTGPWRNLADRNEGI